MRVSQIRQHPVCPYKTLTTFRVTITAIAAAKQASRAIPGKVASLAKQKVDDAKKVMADMLLEERASAEAVAAGAAMDRPWAMEALRARMDSDNPSTRCMQGEGQSLWRRRGVWSWQFGVATVPM